MLSHIVVTRPLTRDELRATNFVTRHVLTDSRKLLYYWRRLPDDRIMFGGRGLVTDSGDMNARQRDHLLSELKAKLLPLAHLTADYDWHGWVCLTRHYPPHIHRAHDDPSFTMPSATRAAAFRSRTTRASCSPGALTAKAWKTGFRPSRQRCRVLRCTGCCGSCSR